MINIQTPFNYKVPKGEINTQPSMTVADMTLTPMEILKRYASGQPIHAMHYTPVYSDEEIPDFKNMDFAEIEEWRANAKEAIDRYRALAIEEDKQHRAKLIEEERVKEKEKLNRFRELLKNDGAKEKDA